MTHLFVSGLQACSHTCKLTWASRAQTWSSNALTHEFRTCTRATVCRCRSIFCAKIFACWSGSYKTQRTSTSDLRSTSVRSKKRLCVPRLWKRGQLPTQTRASSASTRTTRPSWKRHSNWPYLFRTARPRERKALVGTRWDACDIDSDSLRTLHVLVLYITA